MRGINSLLGTLVQPKSNLRRLSFMSSPVASNHASRFFSVQTVRGAIVNVLPVMPAFPSLNYVGGLSRVQVRSLSTKQRPTTLDSKYFIICSN